MYIERRDRLKLVDRLLEREEDRWIARVVVEIHDDVGNLPDQLTQNLALDRCEVEETIQHRSSTPGSHGR